MADSYEKRRRRRGRYDAGSRSDDGHTRQDQHSDHKPPTPMKILGLAKPSKTSSDVPDQSKKSYDEKNYSSIESIGNRLLYQQHDPRILMTGTLSPSTSNKSSNSDASHSSSVYSDNNTQYSQLRKSTGPNSDASSDASSSLVHSPPTTKLAAPMEKFSRTKIINEGFQWLDAGLDLMLEQTDFLVVGVVGLQGSGKSTILSLLAGNSPQDAYKNYIFSPQSKETKEECSYETIGIDMYVTPDRIIYLDCQPLLSSAIMDRLIRYDQKLPSDFSSIQNLVEVQSIQLVTFLISVCNTILVVDDWFVDITLLRLIQDAEMLKPSQTPSTSTSENPTKEEFIECFPTVIFVHNKAMREDFSPDNYNSMQTLLHQVFSTSKLRYKTGINLVNDSYTSIINVPSRKGNSKCHNVNLVLIPPFEFYKCDPENLDVTLPEYRGYPSFNTIFSFFHSQILATARTPLTHNPLTEKAWYHFAARIWESVKKSSLLSEYNRLLTS